MIIILMISPVTATSSCGPIFDYETVYNFHGRVIVASDDLHLPLPGESALIPETDATIHSYRTDIATDKAFPWKGYSSYGWDHDINTVQNGKVYFKLETCTFDDDTRYWYFHLDPPVGYIPASAHPLNVYGTAIDSQTIFYDEDGLPGGDYEFLFQVKRDPKCLEPDFNVNIPQFGDAPPQDVFFTASSVNKNTCGPLWIVDYQWQSYEWDFGDSGSAPAQGKEVIHTYQNAGNYNVKLTVADASGIKRSKSQRVTILKRGIQPLSGYSGSFDCLKPDFTVNIPPTSDTPPHDVFFDAAASKTLCDPIDTYSWEFGDSGTAKGRSVSHTYQNAGDYNVDLTIGDAYGRANTKSQKIHINNSVYLVKGNFPKSINPSVPQLAGASSANRNGETLLDLIASFPQTVLTIVHLAPAPVPETQTEGRDTVVNIMKEPSSGNPDESMQVVVLPPPVEQVQEPSAIMQDSVQIVQISDQPNSIQPPPDFLQHIESGNGTLLEEAPTQIYRVSLPQDYVGNRPQVAYDKLRCPAGYVTCNGICVDLMTDPSYCGSCNSTCPSQYTCGAGVCTPPCSSGQTFCNGACVNLLTDTSNCGTCGNTCTNGGTCGNGQCVLPMVKTLPTGPGNIGITRQHL